MEREIPHAAPPSATALPLDGAAVATETARPTEAQSVQKIRSSAEDDEELRDLFFGC